MDDGSPPFVEILPEELVQFVKPELDPGERLIWSEASKPRKSLRRPIKRLLLGFGCLVASGVLFSAIFGPLRARFLDRENEIIMVGLAIGLVGIIATIVAFYAWMSYVSERDSVPKMTYALTDRRAIIWSPVPRSEAVEIFNFPAGTLKKVYRMEYPDGSGDVWFDDSRHNSDDECYDPFPKGFVGIDHVRAVEDLVRRTLVRPDLRV